jgi:hypothetical protein
VQVKDEKGCYVRSMNEVYSGSFVYGASWTIQDDRSFDTNQIIKRGGTVFRIWGCRKEKGALG